MKKQINGNVSISGVEGIIFDLNGVLTNTSHLHAEAWKQMFDEYRKIRAEKHNTSFTPMNGLDDYFKYIAGKPRYEGVKSYLQPCGIVLPDGSPQDSPSQETICGLGNRKNDIFLRMIRDEGIEAFSDAVEQIYRWKDEGLKIGIVSSSRNCTEMLDVIGLHDFFDTQVDGHVLAEKGLNSIPAPDMFIEAAKSLKIDPENIVIIEDDPAGVNAATDGDFGVVIGINRQGRKKALLENGADLVVKSLREVEIKQGNEDEPVIAQQLPSALDKNSNLWKSLRNKKPVFFLDYDGTLTPIVEHPEDAILSEEMQKQLKEVAHHTTVAIVSGRDMHDVKELVSIDQLIYAGSHGFQIKGPEIEYKLEKSREYLPILDQAEETLRKKLENTIEGAKVERKQFAIAVHYRNVEDEQHIEEIEKEVDHILQEKDKLKKGGGKKILELKPDIEWDKGKAIHWLMEALNIDSQNYLPVYIGDDLTDEDAFKALADIGVGILVGRHGEPTAAQYQLRNVLQVRQFLEKVSNSYLGSD